MTDDGRPRLLNLLASVTLNLGDAAQAALEEAVGVSGAAASALLALDEFLGDAHVGRLADVLGVTHSGAVRLVTLLEREGLAVRRPGDDRRRVEVRLTDLGRRRVAAARAARHDVLARATADLTDDDASALEDALDRVVTTVTEARLAARRAGTPGANGAWWCRTCDFGACGRPEGRCPAHRAAAGGGNDQLAVSSP